MSSSRKRTKSSNDAVKDTQAHIEISAQSKHKGSQRRFYLRTFLGCLSLACFTLVAMPYLREQRFLDSVQFSKSSPSSSSASSSSSSPPSSEYKGPQTKSPKSSPPVQFNSILPFSLPPRSPPSKIIHSADITKQAAIKEAFQDSWTAYVEDAFGSDEYHPISRTGSNFSVDGGVGYFIIDTLDVLLIMGEEEGYRKARDWVQEVDWSNRSGQFSVFETTIRTLGGLLSAHALCQAGKDTLSPKTSQLCSPKDASMFLEKAVALAERLRPAFLETKTGIPLREVDFQSGEAFPDVDNQNMSSLAEVATIQLEFKYLAHATGDVNWWTMVEKPMQALRNAGKKSRSDGLLPIFVSPYTGEMYLSSIRLGSRGDSYYEYLIKQYVQTNHSEAIYGKMYRQAAGGIKRHLLKQSEKSKLLYASEIEPRFYRGMDRPSFETIPKQDHLVCFLGGSYMLGAIHSSSDEALSIIKEEEDELISKDHQVMVPYPPTSIDSLSPLGQEDWSVGHELIRTCMDTYQGTKTGLSAEITMFRMVNDSYDGEEEDWYIKKNRQSQGSPLIDARNILRPETVESLFIAFHLTGDIIYREWGWQIFQAFVRVTKIKEGEEGHVGAFTSIRDVEADEDEIDREDKMETFWLAETLKYLYLLFSDQDTLRLDQWVLNTEAHPLPIFQPTFETSVV